jgi:L-arabinonolactonase
MLPRVECVLDSRDGLGEGVIWSVEDQALYWVDIAPPSRLHRLVPRSGEHQVWAMPESISLVARRNDGTLLIATQRGLSFFDPTNGELQRVAAPEADPLNRSNDGTVDAKGRLWYGTMRNNFAADGSGIPVTEAKGALYRIDPDLTATTMESNVFIPNAACFSPDNRTFYFTEAPAGVIYAYDFDLERGTIANKRPFAAPAGYGDPDGSTVDAEGYVWNARWGAACIVRFAPDGSIDRVIDVPAPLVTCCAFGGENLDTLYITSARCDMTPEQHAQYPLGGALFAFKPGVKGLQRPNFAG